MSQNKTIVPGMNLNSINKDAAADTFYDELYSRSATPDNNRTCIGGGELINEPTNAPLSSFVSDAQRPAFAEHARFFKMKERVVVGVLFSISKGLLGEIFPIYLGKNIIGKNENSDIVLAENTVSPEHAILHTRKTDAGLKTTITDFNSMYGTIVNQEDARFETLTLHENDVITIGHHYKFIIKFFETEKYNLAEDPDFQHEPTQAPAAPGRAENPAQETVEQDFYSPSPKDNDSSRTVLY
ncbi:MAG: FHA domain-containing protein [Sodaliphilus sp.]